MSNYEINVTFRNLVFNPDFLLLVCLISDEDPIPLIQSPNTLSEAINKSCQTPILVLYTQVSSSLYHSMTIISKIALLFVPGLMKWGRGSIEFTIVCLPSVHWHHFTSSQYHFSLNHVDILVIPFRGCMSNSTVWFRRYAEVQELRTLQMLQTLRTLWTLQELETLRMLQTLRDVAGVTDITDVAGVGSEWSEESEVWMIG